MALKPSLKGDSKSKPAFGGGDDEEAPDSEGGGGSDYKAVAKDAAKDGDWDAVIDALCAYIDSK